VDAITVVAYLIFAAVAACTILNLRAIVTPRSVGRVTRVDVRTAAWAGVFALMGVALLVLTLAG
jgi:hypothetical protein